MTTSRGVSALATAALLLAAVTSCAGDGDPAATPASPAPHSSPPTTSSATPPQISPSEEAAAAAADVVRAYYAVRDELRKDLTVPLARLKDVATGGELGAQEALFKRERKEGVHQTGNTKIAKLTVQSVSLDNTDPQAGRVPTVQVDVCYDVSDVDILDATGRSVVAEGRADTGWIRYLVSNYHYADAPTGGWRVASSQSLERKPCDAS